MKSITLIAAGFSFFLFSCKNNMQSSLQYPKTNKIGQADNYFGTSVADPYRWLENDTSSATAEWVNEENKVTFGYLEKIPFRDKIKERLSKIWNYPKYSAPFKKK